MLHSNTFIPNLICEMDHGSSDMYRLNVGSASLVMIQSVIHTMTDNQHVRLSLSPVCRGGRGRRTERAREGGAAWQHAARGRQPARVTTASRWRRGLWQEDKTNRKSIKRCPTLSMPHQSGGNWQPTAILSHTDTNAGYPSVTSPCIER